LANKTVAKRAEAICVAYDNMENYFDAEKIIVTGNPVRDAILDSTVTREEALHAFALDSNSKTILVLGGSLGARTINESIISSIDSLIDAGVNVVWQTGSLYYDEMVERMGERKTANIKVIEFISQMEQVYALADIVISRAGALTISELCLVGKPVVFVPSPNVAEDHQTKNAMALVSKNAADIILDKDAVGQLVAKALEVLDNSDRLDTLSKNIKALARPNATKDIATKALSLIR
jgi:UDP-N-acetylglucosamine--N-acetylmuramyl-(pentapeptide) pyrophosphoryl-undecaprenol N-acetylglucosamine transferase